MTQTQNFDKAWVSSIKLWKVLQNTCTIETATPQAHPALWQWWTKSCVALFLRNFCFFFQHAHKLITFNFPKVTGWSALNYIGRERLKKKCRVANQWQTRALGAQTVLCMKGHAQSSLSWSQWQWNISYHTPGMRNWMIMGEVYTGEKQQALCKVTVPMRISD